MRRRQRATSALPRLTVKQAVGAGVALAIPTGGTLMAAAPALAAPGDDTTNGSASTPRPTLSYGSRGAAVKIVQARVGVTADGIFGPATLSAVKTFQRANGLVPDGIVGARTWAKVGGSAVTPTPSRPTTPTTPTTGTTTPTVPTTTTPACSPTSTTLRMGNSGQLVKVLQDRLGLPTDGWFGANTKAKVLAFQRATGLYADGIVGPRTWTKLGCVGPNAPQPTTPPVSTPSVPSTPATGTAAQVIAFAQTFTGTPYVWGGSSPAGFDCSGLTSYVFKNFGYYMPRTAAQQQAYFPRVSDPQPGDLVFWGYPAYHVGIYVGNGMMIDSSQPGVPVAMRKVYRSPSGYARVIK